MHHASPNHICIVSYIPLGHSSDVCFRRRTPGPNHQLAVYVRSVPGAGCSLHAHRTHSTGRPCLPRDPVEVAGVKGDGCGRTDAPRATEGASSSLPALREKCLRLVRRPSRPRRRARTTTSSRLCGAHDPIRFSGTTLQMFRSISYGEAS